MLRHLRIFYSWLTDEGSRPPARSREAGFAARARRSSPSRPPRPRRPGRSCLRSGDDRGPASQIPRRPHRVPVSALLLRVAEELRPKLAPHSARKLSSPSPGGRRSWPAGEVCLSLGDLRPFQPGSPERHHPAG